MHNSAICVLSVLLRSYMFRHYRHLQGADTKFSLKHTGIQNLQRTYIYFDVKLHHSQWTLVAFYVLRLFRHLCVCVCVRRVMLIWVLTRSAFWMSCVCGSLWPSDLCPWLCLRDFRMHSLSTSFVFLLVFTYALRTILLVICVKNFLLKSHWSYVLYWTS